MHLDANLVLILVSLLAATIKIGLSFFLFKKNPKSRVNQIFSLIFFAQGIWDLGKAI